MTEENKPPLLTDEKIKLAMSDIKNRWLHSKGKKTFFEYDCFFEIISINRFAQREEDLLWFSTEGVEIGWKVYNTAYAQGKAWAIKEAEQKAWDIVNSGDYGKGIDFLIPMILARDETFQSLKELAKAGLAEANRAVETSRLVIY